jgi:hypothetical protein
MKRLTLSGTLRATAAAVVLSISAAPAPLVDVNPSTEPVAGFEEAHGNGMVGWTFQLLQPFTVAQVGWYAKDTNGLSRPFQVGLWRCGGKGSVCGGCPTLPSLIGDPDNGLIIPAGTNASLLGVWRVVDLTPPLSLPVGVYQLGGLDTQDTPDVIEFISDRGPGYSDLTPPGSPLFIGPFFYGALPGNKTNFYPTTSYYAAGGLELGPMLFGTKGPPPWSALGIRLFTPQAGLFSPPIYLLTWPTGTLQRAEEVIGPYTTVTNAASPYLLPSWPQHSFFRLGP